jgi:hypothetical protein
MAEIFRVILEKHHHALADVEVCTEIARTIM